MIESKNNVPKQYCRSRDYKALLKMLDIVTCVAKNDIDNIVSLINPDKCPSKYLPMLASYVGYKYDYNLTYDTNRTIIKYYPQLVKLRGSMAGIELAVALAINLSDNTYNIQDISDIVNINYVESDGRIDIYIYFPNYLNKIDDLIEVVRPIGVRYRIISSNATRVYDKINFEESVTVNEVEYSTSNRYKITNVDEENRNEIGFGEVAKDGEG